MNKIPNQWFKFLPTAISPPKDCRWSVRWLESSPVQYFFVCSFAILIVTVDRPKSSMSWKDIRTFAPTVLREGENTVSSNKTRYFPLSGSIFFSVMKSCVFRPLAKFDCFRLSRKTFPALHAERELLHDD